MLSIAFLEDIWSSNLLSVPVSPLSGAEYLIGLVLFSLGKVVFAVAVMVGLAFVLYGFGVTSLGVGLVPFMGVPPAPLQAAAWLLPASHVFEGMRTVMAGGAVPWDRLAWAGGLNVVYLAGTLGLFAWALRYTRRRGKLSRFGD
ncbi:hypothetical protein [Nonomuraea sp. B19D2]|uniref:hypothetical protein n=1 Tax=Nonomuraea sp. B19D2 TaxID=3159561 RepID=UPI0032DB327D